MPGVEEVVERIKQLEHGRRETGEKLQEFESNDLESDVVVEDGFLKEVAPVELDGTTVAGVDGGLVKKSFQGVDVVLTRAVAAVFSYSDGKLDGTAYEPERSPRPDVKHIESPLDRQEFNVSTSLLRLEKEIKIARSALDQEPDVVLLDGSIVPQYTDRPAEGSKSRKIYDRLMEKYAALFEEALDRGIFLAGVIEDSRSTSLCEVLAEQGFVSGEQSEILANVQDTNMLDYTMEERQRTAVMKYTKEYEKHPTLQDIGETGKKVYNFYLKTATDATPVRIDFLSHDNPRETAERIAATVLPLCSYSSTYGIPSVIVEADQRAKLSEADLQHLESRMKSVVGPLSGIQELRRNSRPF